MMMNLVAYASPMGKRGPSGDDHDHDHDHDNDYDHDRPAGSGSGSIPPGTPITGITDYPEPPSDPWDNSSDKSSDYSMEDDPDKVSDTMTHDKDTALSSIPSKALIPWYDLIILNPHLDPDFVPAGSVVRVPPRTSWIARHDETIISVANHFVSCVNSYNYGLKNTLDPILLARMNGFHAIDTPLPRGHLIRLPPDAGYLAFRDTKFEFIFRNLAFRTLKPEPRHGPTHSFY